MTEEYIVRIPKPRIFRALPERDEDLGEIRWDRFEPLMQTLCTKGGLSNACPTCAFPGPLNGAEGRTRREATVRTHRKITQKSKIAEGQRVKSVLVHERVDERWLISHYAIRCPACEETKVLIFGSCVKVPVRCEPSGDAGPSWPGHDWGKYSDCKRCGYPKDPRPGKMYECLDMYQPPVTERVPSKNPDADTLF
ncbi:hypothetical protein ABT282_08750 [Streptomyces sp. NPDC000927]|uniref:hypothetical protein n=1 Tax=Streptomyces sp. NPDC000927 TaxID=3154371 RepID=UPI003322AF04